LLYLVIVIKVVKKTAEESYEGVPREKIPWDPQIDYEKCIACGKCVDYCHVGAFKFEEKDDKKKTVVNPNKCIVFCRGCEDICPAGAISHPSEEETQKIIDKLKKAKA
jgi:ferredoxin